MKKKILSTLLASCLFVGMAIPAVMAANSSKSGTDDQITSAKFDANSYTVVNGGDELDLASKLTAFCGNDKIAEEPTIEYTLENDTKLAFTIDESTGLVSSQEDSGSAKVTVSLNGGKVKATTTLTAKKAVDPKPATSFTVVAPAKLPIDNKGVTPLIAEDQVIVLKPYPSGSTFEGSTIFADIKAAAPTLTATEDTATTATSGTIAVTGNTKIQDDGNIELVISKAALINLVADEYDSKAKNFDLTTDAGVTKSIKMQAVKAVSATGVGLAKSSMDVEVGAKDVDVSGMFKPTPSAANVGRAKTITNADGDDFAVVTGEKVNAYAKGVTKIDCEIAGKVVTAKINVVSAGSVTTNVPKINTEKVTVKVGEVAPITITGGTDLTVSWVYNDNGSIGLTNNNKLSTAVIGKKVGTSTVVGTLSNGTKFTVAVNVVAATANKPGTGNGTDVPQTGDSLFANLFN